SAETKKPSQIGWKEPLEEVRVFKKQDNVQSVKRPTYVLNILYKENGNFGKGIYLSKRIQRDKEMCNLWQSPGGKVEKRESSVQATLRETKEETGIQLDESHLIFLFNDPTYNCDVYVSKIPIETEPQHTEPQKQGPWKLYAIEEYQRMATQGKTTPTHTQYIDDIMKSLVRENTSCLQQSDFV